MGHTTYPCPACFQSQSVTHANGQEVETNLCAACQEESVKANLSKEAFVKAKHALARKAAEVSR